MGEELFGFFVSSGTLVARGRPGAFGRAQSCMLSLLGDPNGSEAGLLFHQLCQWVKGPERELQGEQR